MQQDSSSLVQQTLTQQWSHQDGPGDDIGDVIPQGWVARYDQLSGDKYYKNLATNDTVFSLEELETKPRAAPAKQPIRVTHPCVTPTRHAPGDASRNASRNSVFSNTASNTNTPPDTTTRRRQGTTSTTNRKKQNLQGWLSNIRPTQEGATGPELVQSFFFPNEKNVGVYRNRYMIGKGESPTNPICFDEEDDDDNTSVCYLNNTEDLPDTKEMMGAAIALSHLNNFGGGGDHPSLAEESNNALDGLPNDSAEDSNHDSSTVL